MSYEHSKSNCEYFQICPIDAEGPRYYVDILPKDRDVKSNILSSSLEYIFLNSKHYTNINE